MVNSFKAVVFGEHNELAIWPDNLVKQLDIEVPVIELLTDFDHRYKLLVAAVEAPLLLEEAHHLVGKVRAYQDRFILDLATGHSFDQVIHLLPGYRSVRCWV